MQQGQALRLMRYIWPQWYLLPPIVGSMVIATLLALAPPWLLGVVLIDKVILPRDATLVPWVVFGLLAVALLRQVFDLAQRYFLALLSQRAIHRLRCGLYQHLEHLPAAFFSQAPVGDLVSRQVNDADALEHGFNSLVTEVGVHLVMVLGTLALLFSLNAKLTLIILPFMVLLGVTMHVFRQVVKGSSLGLRQRTGHLASVATETLLGIGVVKAFSMEQAELDRFSRMSQNILRANLRLVKLEGFYSSIVEIILVSSTVLVVWLAAPQALAGQMTVGALVAYLGYLARFYDPLKGLSRANFQIQRALGAAQRIFAVLDTATEVQEADGNSAMPRARGHLAFQGVTFGYHPDRPVLKDFCLEATPGETVALVGPSGAGKTTVINLLLRFYAPQGGRILLDGAPLDRMAVQSLRRQMALVPQEAFLFSTTLRENILYGKPEATQAEIEGAARAANIHDFIASLPQGYETPVGQRGVALSGGQRQRIALARAIVKNPDILILVVATSSLDTTSEALIEQAITSLKGRVTIIAIAHRVATVMRADRLLVFENGSIVEEGAPEHLAKDPNSAFARIYLHEHI